MTYEEAQKIRERIEKVRAFLDPKSGATDGEKENAISLIDKLTKQLKDAGDIAGPKTYSQWGVDFSPGSRSYNRPSNRRTTADAAQKAGNFWGEIFGDADIEDMIKKAARMAGEADRKQAEELREEQRQKERYREQFHKDINAHTRRMAEEAARKAAQNINEPRSRHDYWGKIGDDFAEHNRAYQQRIKEAEEERIRTAENRAKQRAATEARKKATEDSKSFLGAIDIRTICYYYNSDGMFVISEMTIEFIQQQIEALNAHIVSLKRANTASENRYRITSVEIIRDRLIMELNKKQTAETEKKSKPRPKFRVEKEKKQ